MKKYKFLLLLSCLFILTTTAEAQFLNRLKKKVIERAENVIIDKTADKAAERTSKTMDKVLNPKLDALFNMGTGKTVDVSELPAEYKFDYLYRLKMSAGEGELEMDYLFNKNENYFGAKTAFSPDMLMVFDTDNNLIVMKSGESVIARQLDVTSGDNDEEVEVLEDYSFSEVPSRVFHGINCPGYVMENSENKITFYIAPDVGVGFGNNNSGKGNIANLPKEMQALSNKYENGLMMYMEMENKLNTKDSDQLFTSMECVVFEETSSTIKIR